MWLAIEWHQRQWPWVTLKVTLAVWNFSTSHNSSTINYATFACDVNRKTYVACNFNCRIKTETLLKVAYAVEVEMRKIGTLLPQIINVE